MTCGIEGCDRKAYTVNQPVLCNMHWQRNRKMAKTGKELSFIHHGGSRSSEYWSWSGMKARCYNPNNPKYGRYGERGIKVCDRWLGAFGFSNFIEDMGKKPSPQHSIDRIDNDGNYEPSNCRWATPHQQTSNRSSNKGSVGVYYDSNPGYKNRWSADLQLNGKRVFYGRFATKSEAIKARQDAEAAYLPA